MAINLPRLAFDRSKGVLQDIIIAVEIDGLSTILGSGRVSQYIRVGDPDLFIGDDWVIGGIRFRDDQKDIITFDGTTSSINQQLNPDKGNVSSISGYQVSLLDQDGYATSLITPGSVFSDILGRRSNIHIGYRGTAFPQDYVQIFSGIIDEVIGGPTIIFNVAHPEQKKRGEIYTKQTKKLTAQVHYRSATIQGINYQTRYDVLGTVTVTYTGAGTAGLETVTVVGNSISVDLQPGVSTANQIRNAIEKSQNATALVSTQVVSGQQGLLQNTQSSTPLGSSSSISLDNTSGMLLPADSGTLRTYVRIKDEIIEYTGISSNTLTGLTREAFFSIDERAAGARHKSGEKADTFYRLQGNAIDLALKILMSGPDEYFATEVKRNSINQVEDVGFVQNAVYFQGVNVINKYGLTVGDFVTIENDSIIANNVTLIQIASIETNDLGSYIILDNSVTLVTNIDQAGTCSFKSKYNVLPEGAGLNLGGDEVDVPEFERIKQTFSSSIFSYDFYLKDTIVAKDFIDQKILFPTGAFTIPRLGKISIGYSSPPLAVNGVQVFDADNTTNPNQTRISRSINKQFYNTVVFKYNESPLDDDFLNGVVTQDADSKNRIPVGNRVFTIEANGLRDSQEISNKIGRVSERLLDRFKFGAEKVQVKSFFGPGFNQDVGDVVLYGEESLNLPDTKFGNRSFQPRLFEISNRQINLQSGEISYQLLDTTYSIEDARFGIVSPASLLGAGSTASRLIITDSFSTVPPQKEYDKWDSFVGQKVQVRSDDLTFQEETFFVGFDPVNPYAMLLNPPLPSAPSAGFKVAVADYQDADDSLGAIYKSVFVFTDPSVNVISGSSTNEFDVAPGDVSKFHIGSPVILHNDDWSVVSPETKVQSITGQTIATEEVLGFTPDNTFKVELIGFQDGGSPYRYV